jgi:hypothetical protein
VRTRLFHTLVVCGSALGALSVACASDADDDLNAESAELYPDAAGADAGASRAADGGRCRAADGGCNEHCAPIASGGCLDPCFVHTTTCSPDCLEFDGSCGWPPTK